MYFMLTVTQMKINKVVDLFPFSTCLGLIWASHMWMDLPMQRFHFHLSSILEFMSGTKSTRFLGEWPNTNLASQSQLPLSFTA